jgi:hypothetical protein
MTEKKEFFFKDATVKFYTLDAPFGQSGMELQGKKITNGKVGLTVLVPADAEGVQETVSAIGKNGSINSEVIDGKAFHKITAKTGFLPKVADAEGNIIDAPTDVRINLGDTMKVSMAVTPYSGVVTTENGTKKPYSGLNLLLVKILDHDKSNRQALETDEESGSKLGDLLAAL